ncbi:hypothetical protein CLAFUR0_03686 [Fulvia fulva]|nr:hypothetical protein CLAFUR0_03686 [Fulvia fulva]
MPSSRLLPLPVELQTAIVEYIPRPSDLKSRCLTCKQLRDVATPKLYHTVILDCHAWRDKCSFLTHSNLGHQHVKKLTIYDYPEELSVTVQAAANVTIRSALSLIPQDALRVIQSPRKLEIEEQTWSVLGARQRKLEEVGMVLNGLQKYTLRSVVETCFKHLRSLVVLPYIRTKNDLDIYNRVLSNCRDLKSLNIFRSIGIGGAHVNAASFKSCSEASVFTLSRLFPNPPKDRMQLEILALALLDLAIATDVLHARFDLSCIHSLTALSCENLPSLLASFTGSILERHNSLVAVQLCSKEYDKDVAAIENFLASFAGLEYLQITFHHNKDLLDPQHLNTHRITLRHLQVSTCADFRSPLRATYEISQLASITQNFLELQQLALVMPTITLGEFARGDLGDFGRVLDLIAALSKLEILHILNWPLATIESNEDTENHYFKKSYLRDVDDFASSVVQRLFPPTASHTGPLKVLRIGESSWGTSTVRVDRAGSRGTGDGDFFTHKQGRSYYLIGHFVDCFGVRKPSAVRSPAQLVKFAQPEFNAVPGLGGPDHGMAQGHYFRPRSLR